MYCMDPNLGGFVKFLEGQGLVKLDILGDGEEHFINRLKLQKYALLAKRFGMPFPYRHSIYLYGPYSNRLGVDYEELARSGSYDEYEPTTPAEFRRDDFLKAIRNDPKWLNIAATIVDINDDVEERTALMEEVCRIKSMFDKEFIAGVLGDLEKHHLVTVRA